MQQSETKKVLLNEKNSGLTYFGLDFFSISLYSAEGQSINILRNLIHNAYQICMRVLSSKLSSFPYSCFIRTHQRHSFLQFWSMPMRILCPVPFHSFTLVSLLCASPEHCSHHNGRSNRICKEMFPLLFMNSRFHLYFYVPIHMPTQSINDKRIYNEILIGIYTFQIFCPVHETVARTKYLC